MRPQDILTALQATHHPIYVLETGQQVFARAISQVHGQLLSMGHNLPCKVTAQYLVEHGYTIHYGQRIIRGEAQGKWHEILVIPDV